jgi:hypothetical protein
MAKNIKCGNKKVKVSEKLFVSKDGNIGTILVSDCCPYTNEQCADCKNCYGKIIQIEIEEYSAETHEYKKTKKTLRDRFVQNNNDILEKNEATKYIDACDIISRAEQDKKETRGSMSSPWTYTERSLHWKTDCIVCRKKYKNKNELTPCKKATKHYEDAGINIKYASNEQIVNHVLPEECICKEQNRQIIKFY